MEPTLVQSKKLSDRLGYLKVAMFPGMIGVEVSNAMSDAVAELGNIGKAHRGPTRKYRRWRWRSTTDELDDS